jgi:hypothetical protein
MQTSSSRSQSSFSIKVASTSGKDDMAAMEEQAMHKSEAGQLGRRELLENLRRAQRRGSGIGRGRGDMEVLVDG